MPNQSRVLEIPYFSASFFWVTVSSQKKTSQNHISPYFTHEGRISKDIKRYGQIWVRMESWKILSLINCPVHCELTENNDQMNQSKYDTPFRSNFCVYSISNLSAVRTHKSRNMSTLLPVLYVQLFLSKPLID